jgi:hypothetical protein
MKNKYSDGEDIITSDDDNPDDQEVYREFQSTGVKIRDTPPGKKAVGRNTPRSTAPRKQEDASPKTPVAKPKATASRKQEDASPNQLEEETKRWLDKVYPKATPRSTAPRKQEDASPKTPVAKPKATASRKQEDASPNQLDAETKRWLDKVYPKAMPRPNQSEAKPSDNNRAWRAYAAKRKQEDARPTASRKQEDASPNQSRAYAAKRKQEDASPKTPVAKPKATTLHELRGQRATRAGEQQQRRQLQRGKMEFRSGATGEFRSGGYVKSADGCAKRGKTKAKMV